MASCSCLLQTAGMSSFLRHLQHIFPEPHTPFTSSLPAAKAMVPAPYRSLRFYPATFHVGANSWKKRREYSQPITPSSRAMFVAATPGSQATANTRGCWRA